MTNTYKKNAKNGNVAMNPSQYFY